MAKAVWFLIGSMIVIAILTPSRQDDAKVTQAAAIVSAPSIASAPPAVGVATPSGASITLTRASDGHFYADALVNGAPVHFLVDTGATTLALSKGDAQLAGLRFTDADFTDTAQAAGGDIRIKRVTLDRVAIGAVEAQNIDAAIVDGNLGVSLLGQNWLKRFDSVSIKGDTMTIG